MVPDDMSFGKADTEHVTCRGSGQGEGGAKETGSRQRGRRNGGGRHREDGDDYDVRSGRRRKNGRLSRRQRTIQG